MRWGIRVDGWSRWFAWKPVRLMSGQWAWLEWVEVTDFFNHEVPYPVPYNVRMFGRSFAARHIDGAQP